MSSFLQQSNQMALSFADKKLGYVKRTSATICEFEWSIQDFDSLSGERYASPFFSFAGVNWKLIITPNTIIGSNSTRYIWLALARKSCIPSLKLEVFFSFKTSDGREDRCRYHPNQHNIDSEIDVYVATNCLSRNELLKRKSELLPSNVLTVLCTLKYLKSTKDASEGCTLGTFISPHNSKVLYDFKELFLQKEDCDVVMKVKEQEFFAHKNILKARSSVLASTFRNDMKEKTTGVVDIKDCDPSSFSDFICFLYCGDSDVISKENVFSLFTAADKYDVQDLKEKCVKLMRENLSVDTFCDTLTVALLHSERKLIEITTDFFVENAREITLTVKWQTFLAENPTEGNELFVKLLASNSSNSSK